MAGTLAAATPGSLGDIALGSTAPGFSPVVITHVASIQSTNNTTVYTSAPFTPTPGSVMLVFLAGTNFTTVASVVTDAPLDFDLATPGFTWGTGDRMQCWIAENVSEGVPQSLTITLSDADAADTMVAEIVEVTNHIGFLQFVQSNEASGVATTTPSVVFDVAPGAANPVFGMVAFTAINPNITEPAGWTEHFDGGIGTPSTGLEVASKSQTGPTTVTWGSASSVDWDAVIFEFEQIEVEE